MTTRRQGRRNERALDKATGALSATLKAAYATGATRPSMGAVGLHVQNNVRKLLSQGGSGRTYGRHTASAPGQPPAVDTGRLRASYTHEVGEDARGPYVDIGTNVEYAPFLEFGTRHIAPRPHLRPAVEQETQRIATLIIAQLSANLARAARR